MFADWNTVTGADPSANGMGTAGQVLYSWIHGGYLYIWYYHSTTSSTISGVYRRTIVGDPPTHTTHEGFVSLSDLFNLAGAANRAGPAFYDPTEGAIYLTRYYTTAQTGIVGKWLMSDWPFTYANREWIAVDTSYGGYEAGKVGNSVSEIFVVDGKVFLASVYYGHVLTFDAATGAALGEWVYYATWSSGYRFRFFGWDAANSYIIGGMRYRAGLGLDGSIRSWNISDLNLWTPIGVVLPRKGAQNHHEELHGGTLVDLYFGAPYSGAQYDTLSPSEIAALSYLPAGTILSAAGSSYYSAGNCFVEMNLDGATYHRHSPASAARLAGLSGQRSNRLRARICTVGGAAYLQTCGHGSLKLLDANGESYPFCPYFQHVDEGTYVSKFIATQNETPKKLLIDLHASARNREFSAHPGKHAFRMNVDGGAWTDWRAGHELLRLDEVIGAKAAWPAYTTGQVIRIQHKMTAGLFRHLLPPVYTEESGEPGEELASLFDAGAPKEVQPVLSVSPIERGGGLL